jgi:hypothetical protein
MVLQAAADSAPASPWHTRDVNSAHMLPLAGRWLRCVEQGDQDS